MDLNVLRRYAEGKLAEVGLAQAGWRFAYDRAKTRFGVCRFNERVISVSRVLAEANPEAECQDTVLHEIAHALAGRKAGHGPAWKRACRAVGAKPVRCYTAATVRQPDPKYWAACPACEHRVGYYKRPRATRACLRCCRRHSGGGYDERFRLRIVEAATGRELPPELRPARTPRYVGTCPACRARYPFYRSQNFNKACGACCNRHSGGQFDPRFRLVVAQVAGRGSGI